MNIEFETEEEELAFIKYATSTEKTDSTSFENLRKKLNNHKRAKMGGGDLENEKATLEHAMNFYAEGYEVVLKFIWEYGQDEALQKYLFERTGASSERVIGKDTYTVIVDDFKVRSKIVGL
ncbi:hypothetical protein [Paenibacillus sp. FSL H3-0333]|uniref:hypothetical protein n=1 Tax=Paenibacillus sp. FSL H3-0333 TaxID=2921373 RepID=UPI0030FD0ADB